MKLRTALAFALPFALTACGDLCVALCTDQTTLQRQYVDTRDVCRENAELKMTLNQADMPDEPPQDKASKAKLVTLFSECMTAKGWPVPDPSKPPTPAAAVAAKLAEEKLTPPPPPPQKVQDALAQRAAECEFARQAADVSVAARKRAQACDLECAEAERLAPEAPKAPACH